MKQHTTKRESSQESSRNLPSSSNYPNVTIFPINNPRFLGLFGSSYPADVTLLPKMKIEGHSESKEKKSSGQYMYIDELASYIKRTEGSIRNLVSRGVIPYRKQAGRLVFLKDEIDKWIQMAPGKTLDEIKNDI